MADKVVQLHMFKTDKEQFDEIVVKSMRSLFARDTTREKDLVELKQTFFSRDTTREKDLIALKKRTLELEEVVYRMDKRLNNIV
jgi:hypothetical protein